MARISVYSQLSYTSRLVQIIQILPKYILKLIYFLLKSIKAVVCKNKVNSV